MMAIFLSYLICEYYLLHQRAALAPLPDKKISGGQLLSKRKIAVVLIWPEHFRSGDGARALVRPVELRLFCSCQYLLLRRIHLITRIGTLEEVHQLQRVVGGGHPLGWVGDVILRLKAQLFQPPVSHIHDVLVDVVGV